MASVTWLDIDPSNGTQLPNQVVGIGDILKVPQRKLSFGQRKRCELVAALLHDPRVIFLDEPTNAMDLLSARRVRRFIREMGSDGNHTIILTSHIMADIEEVCDRVIIINQGSIVYDGNTRDLQEHGRDLKSHVKNQPKLIF